MPVLIPIGIAIGTATATAVVVIATVVATISVAVGTALLALGALVVGTVAAIVQCTVSALTWAASGIISGITTAFTGVMGEISVIGKGIWMFSKALVSGMKAFLEAIHFKTIIKIHSLAMIFSKDYKDMMDKVYGQIRQVSEALGMGADFLSLILNDARSVVMSTSSLYGTGYDLGEVQWLSTMNGYIKDFSTKAEIYENNPSALLRDMNTYIQKPSIDAKANAQATFITIFEGVVTVADATAEKVVTLREDLEQTILHLPPVISREIYDKINPIFEGFDNFIQNEYRPVAKDISNAIHVLNDTTERQTDRLRDLTRSILNPGDLLGNVDNLSDLERIRQEGKIAEIANRAPVRSVKEVNLRIDKAHKGLKEIYEAITEVREKPPYHVPEAKGLVYAPGAVPALYKSWFVGDF